MCEIQVVTTNEEVSHEAMWRLVDIGGSALGGTTAVVVVGWLAGHGIMYPVAERYRRHFGRRTTGSAWRAKRAKQNIR